MFRPLTVICIGSLGACLVTRARLSAVLSYVPLRTVRRALGAPRRLDGHLLQAEGGRFPTPYTQMHGFPGRLLASNLEGIDGPAFSITLELIDGSELPTLGGPHHSVLFQHIHEPRGSLISDAQLALQQGD